MCRARPLSLVTVVLFAFLICSGLLAQQNSKPDASGQNPSNTNSTSLKISLRLSDDAFSGLANLRVTTEQGAEVAGKLTDSEGETLFSTLARGSYSVEASAPGFVSIKQTVEIKLGQGVETVFLVMRPAVFPDSPSVGFSAANENAAFHIPSGIDEVVPKVLPRISCDLPMILYRAGERMT